MMGTPAADVKIKAWTPAILCKIQDNIVSSKFANAKIFMPSYDSTRVRPSMEQLLTNEYQRIWWEEKEAWDKKFSRKTVSKSLLQRKVIPRKPPTKCSPLEVPKKTGKSKRKVQSPLKQKDSKKSVLQKKSEGSIKQNKSEKSIPQKKSTCEMETSKIPDIQNISLNKDLQKKEDAESPLEEGKPGEKTETERIKTVSPKKAESERNLEDAKERNDCGCMDHA